MSRRGAEVPRSARDLVERYGAWALVAGASEGLGAAWARALAGRGFNLVVVARRAALLEEVAAGLRVTAGVEVLCYPGDLAEPTVLEDLDSICVGLDIGLLVYNAAEAPVGDFVAASPAELSRVVDVNVRGPVVLLRSVLPGMAERGRGAVVLMSSLAGNQGSARLATYAASKAFNRVLAEGLWHEVGGRGVDVVACCAGAIRTPGYAGTAGKDAPGTLDPEEVVDQVFRALGHGPVVIPGFVNRVANVFMGGLLPRRAAITIMAGSTEDLAPTRLAGDVSSPGRTPSPDREGGS
jgi:short-subunit dehydrogenase